MSAEKMAGNFFVTNDNNNKNMNMKKDNKNSRCLNLVQRILGRHGGYQCVA